MTAELVMEILREIVPALPGNIRSVSLISAMGDPVRVSVSVGRTSTYHKIYESQLDDPNCMDLLTAAMSRNLNHLGINCHDYGHKTVGEFVFDHDRLMWTAPVTVPSPRPE